MAGKRQGAREEGGEGNKTYIGTWPLHRGRSAHLEGMPGRHSSCAWALKVLVWGAALVLGRGSGESDPKPIEREVRPGDEIWEGGIDRGSVGCVMGRINGGTGKCMSEENCVLPVGKDQRGNCLMHNLERHGLGRYSKSWAKATYACACCNTTLFSSEDKFNDGRPSFLKPTIITSLPPPHNPAANPKPLLGRALLEIKPAFTHSHVILKAHSAGHGFATFTRPISMGVVGYRDHQVILSRPLSPSAKLGFHFPAWALESCICPRAPQMCLVTTIRS